MTKPVAGIHKGRRAGTPNRKTVAKTAVALIAAGAVAKITRGAVSSKLRAVAQDGISPKDLMLSSMRDYQVAAHALGLEALAVEQEAEKLPITPPDPDTGALSARSLLEQRANYLRHAAELQLDKANDLAARVAPYLHAKLANQDIKLVGDIQLTLKKYRQ